MSTSSINIGMLGYGFMGRIHSHAYASLPHIFPDLERRPQLDTVVGTNIKTLSAFAQRFGYRHASTSWQEVVDDPSIDIIDVCLPLHLHEEVSTAALAAGKHVICEKPLGPTVDICKRMALATEASKGTAMCGFCFRFLPAVRFARDLIRQGAIGDLYFIRCDYHADFSHDQEIARAQLGDGKQRYGALIGMGSHAIDLVRYLAGDFRSVMAIQRNFVLGRSHHEVEFFDQLSTISFELASGAVGTLSASVVSTGHGNDLSFEVNGSRGSLAFNLTELNELKVHVSNPSNPEVKGFTSVNVTRPQHPIVNDWLPPSHNLGWESAHLYQLHHLVASISSQREVKAEGATFLDGLRVAEVTEASRRSSTVGHRVYLSTNLCV